MCSKMLGPVYVASLLVDVFLLGGLSPLILENIKFTQYLSTNPGLQRIIKRKTLTQGGKICPRKGKKVIFQQT